MNGTTMPLEPTDVTENPQGQSIGGFGYGLGISLGLLLLIFVATYASYTCARLRVPGLNPRSSHVSSTDTTTTDNSSRSSVAIGIPGPGQAGLDEATLLSYPKLLYSQAKLHNEASSSSGCSICLADYKDTDMLLLLPDCGHLFHFRCIDPWLRFNPTCPICRNSPLPTPLETPCG